MQHFRLALLLVALATMVCLQPAVAEESWWQQQFNAIEKPASRPASRPAAAPVPARWRTVVIPVPFTPPTLFAARSPMPPAAIPPHAAPPVQKPLTGYAHELRGLASFYNEAQLTSTGEAFDKSALTAAHKTLPLGTRVRVTNLANGRSTIVRINDRGPFKPGRVIDLSEAAAEQIAMTGPGIARVVIDVVK